jgi:hypothetical protein
MDRTKILNLIENMKTAHETQMYDLELLLSGKDIESITPLSKTECDFGKLLYANESVLRQIIGSLFYEKLDTLHEKWHEEYQKIFDIYKEYFEHKSSHKGLFSKLLGAKKVDEMNIDKAKLYYSDLKQTTNELLHTIDISKRRIVALADTKFE